MGCLLSWRVGWRFLSSVYAGKRMNRSQRASLGHERAEDNALSRVWRRTEASRPPGIEGVRRLLCVRKCVWNRRPGRKEEPRKPGSGVFTRGLAIAPTSHGRIRGSSPCESRSPRFDLSIPRSGESSEPSCKARCRGGVSPRGVPEARGRNDLPTWPFRPRLRTTPGTGPVPGDPGKRLVPASAVLGRGDHRGTPRARVRGCPCPLPDGSTQSMPVPAPRHSISSRNRGFMS